MAYVTLQEFKNAPTGVDTLSIIPGGTTAQNDAELMNVLERASDWVNRTTHQKTLMASVDTEIRPTHMDRDGRITVRPFAGPVIEVKEMAYRSHPSQGWTQISADSIQVYDGYFVASGAGSIGLNIPLGYPTPLDRSARSRVNLTVKYTYVNGYMHSTLAADAFTGDTQIVVTDPAAAYEGLRLTLYDNEKTEVVTVLSVDGNVLHLAAPLQYMHEGPVGVSALPHSVKQATILYAAYLIKARGSLSVSMNETSLQGIGRYVDAADLKLAETLLQPFKKVL